MQNRASEETREMCVLEDDDVEYVHDLCSRDRMCHFNDYIFVNVHKKRTHLKQRV